MSPFPIILCNESAFPERAKDRSGIAAAVFYSYSLIPSP